ncbi:MAG TPA: phosphoribosylglycinamide formyltransferase [Burkholderiales bacterium]
MPGAGRAAPRCRVVVLISGRGSNLQAIIRAMQRGEIAIDLAAVISNRPNAPGLEYARAAGIPAEVVDHKAFAERAAFEAALSERIDAYRPDLIVLAGFMRVLSASFIERYAGRLINIHPSLLPAFPGLRTHERALAAGARMHGATVHFVTAEVDSGPIIAQAAVPVLPDDTPDSLAARVLEQEHRLYPRVIGWFAEGRLRLVDGQVMLDGRANHPAQGLVTGAGGRKT